MVAALVIGVLVGVLAAGDSNGGGHTTVIHRRYGDDHPDPDVAAQHRHQHRDRDRDGAAAQLVAATGQTAALGYAASMAACVLTISCMV